MTSAQLTRRQRKRLEAIVLDLEKIELLANKLPTGLLHQLVVRDGLSIVPDGYSPSSRYDVPHSSGVSTPTESAVLARQKTRKDELRQALRGIERCIADARDLVEAASVSLDYIVGTEEETKQRTASTPCPVCNLLPIVSAGLCVKDLDDWHRDNRPDRHLWLLWKTQARSSEGELLVAEKPGPRSSGSMQPGRARLQFLGNTP